MAHRLTVTAHAARRWAQVVIPLLDAESDPRTLREWQRAAGTSATSLRCACAAVGWTARNTLDLGRVLRAVHIGRTILGWDPHNVLDVADGRTLMRMFDRMGVPYSSELPPSAEDLLSRQRRHVHPAAKAMILAALQVRCAPTVASDLARMRWKDADPCD